MSNPEHQHFIPKSYLKNFALERDKKFFVEAKLKRDDSPKDRLLSINDICVDKNIYTLPIEEESDNKYSLEKFYAEKVDSLYPWIYKKLTDPNVVYISSFERSQIIMITMSLFFKTPKFLNHNERKIENILNHAIRYKCDKNGNIQCKIDEIDLDFNVEQLEEVRANLKIRNKLNFLIQHLKDWNQFVKFKINAGISVYRIVDEINLITSDNPVIMYSVVGNQFNIFDPTNIISLPLDDKHYLTIFPNTEASLVDRIFRGDRDKWFALVTNLEIEQNSEEWILGKPNSVTNHLSDQKKYGEINPENLQAFEDIKEKAQDAMELVELINNLGTPIHPKVASRVRELRKKRIFKNDGELQKFILELARNGYLTIKK